jgi:hypothetical protein
LPKLTEVEKLTQVELLNFPSQSISKKLRSFSYSFDVTRPLDYLESLAMDGIVHRLMGQDLEELRKKSRLHLLSANRDDMDRRRSAIEEGAGWIFVTRLESASSSSSIQPAKARDRATILNDGFGAVRERTPYDSSGVDKQLLKRRATTTYRPTFTLLYHSRAAEAGLTGPIGAIRPFS